MKKDDVHYVTLTAPTRITGQVADELRASLDVPWWATTNITYADAEWKLSLWWGEGEPARQAAS